MQNKILEGIRFLIAEDNPTNQIVITQMIEQLGGSYDLAQNGLEAIQLFDPSKYDFALLDIEMPKKSGLEVIRYIRAREDVGEDFPVVALTAFVLNEHKEKIQAAGASGILAKPIFDIQKFGKELLRFARDGSAINFQEFDINPNALEELTDVMGRDVMPELLVSLMSDFEKIYKQLPQYGQNNAIGELRSGAHALLSLANMSGAMKLRDIAEIAEQQAEVMDEMQFNSTVDELQKEIQAAIAYVEDFKAR